MTVVLALFLFDALQAVFDRAAAALETGDFAAAASGFEQVLRQKPRHVGALGNLGVAYSRMNRAGDAVGAYKRALRIAPADPGLERNLALAYLKLGEHAAAKPLLEKLGERELLAIAQVHTGGHEAAIPTLESLAPSPSVLYALGLAYLKRGDREKARKFLDESLPASLQPAQGAFLRGKAFYDGSLFDEAIAEFETAIRLDASNPATRLELARSLISARNNARAEKELRAVLPDAEAAYLLGALLAVSGREAEALPLLEGARKAAPASWAVLYYIGRARLQSGGVKAAIASLEESAQLNPDEPAVLYQLARAYAKAGFADRARQASARVAELKRQGVERDQRAVIAR